MAQKAKIKRSAIFFCDMAHIAFCRFHRPGNRLADPPEDPFYQEVSPTEDVVSALFFCHFFAIIGTV